MIFDLLFILFTFFLPFMCFLFYCQSTLTIMLFFRFLIFTLL